MITEAEIIELIEKEDKGPTLDYKEDLKLQTDGDKAQFVKDVLSLANSGQTAHIIIGVEDGTKKLVGIKTPRKAEQLNSILKVKCDPPLTVEYVERAILGHTVGVIEIIGENPPYIVAVHDRYGGYLSSDPKNPFFIDRGTVFVRKYNMNEGASRADLDKMFEVKYVTLQADLKLSYKVSVKQLDDSKEADIKFFLENLGEVLAADAFLLIQSKDIRQIVRCRGDWKDISSANKNIPTIRLLVPSPLLRPIIKDCAGVVVKVDPDLDEIEARVILGATNMRTRDGPYVISLKKKG